MVERCSDVQQDGSEKQVGEHGPPADSIPQPTSGIVIKSA